jgi:hypothetical protein
MPSCHHQQLDPFSILGLPRFASIADIKASYQRLASMYLHDKLDEDRLMVISAAFEVLTTSRDKLMRRKRFTDPHVLFQANFGMTVEPSDDRLVFRASTKRESPNIQKQLYHEANKRRRTAIC